MDSARQNQPLRNLVNAFKRGDLSRRQFIEGAGALGVAGGMATFMANSALAGSGRNGFAFYPGQDGTPAASPVAGASAIPREGMDNVTRGEGGELRMIQWQAPSAAFIHTATGTKEYLVSDMILEPLMRYLPDGTIIPYLVNEVPSVENGLLAEDLSSVTFNLKEGIVWSDGEPFTSHDVQFTWQWITHEDNASVNFLPWSTISGIDTPDELTAVVNFVAPAANWFEPLVGGNYGAIIPAHAFGDDPANRNEDFDTAPIGTGPYKVDSFAPGDLAQLSMNEQYWQPNAPYFATINVKGGGDAASAARAVVQTGEYDYAWNLQVEPDVLNQMLEGDAKGQFVTVQGTSLERININFSDPNTEVDGQLSHFGTPNPVMSDPAVRNAMNKAVKRDVIANEFYGEGQPATANVLNGIASFESPNTSWEYDLDEAKQILDDAGWTMEGDTRAKDGVELTVSYATSVNQVRQKTQAVVKEAFNELGIGVQLEQVDSTVFFSGSAGNSQNINHFFWDLEMYTNNPSSPVPIQYMIGWYAGEGDSGSNVAQKENGWQGQNYYRYANDEYDARYEELVKVTNTERANELLIEMNDILINDVALIPEVNRAADKYAISLELNNDNVAMSAFEYNYWNVANWNRV